MKDEEIIISLKDGLKLKGILNHSSNDKLVILIHGLKGSSDSRYIFNGSRFLLKNGYSVFRPDLYGPKPKFRKLSESSIHTHASDVNDIIQYFSGKYRDVHIIAASLAGPSVIMAPNHEKIKSLVLWDGSIDLGRDRVNISRDVKFNSNINLYIKGIGIEYLISQDMVDSFEDTANEIMLPRLKVNTAVISGTESVLLPSWKTIYKKYPLIQKFTVISGADHTFSVNNAEQQLFKETLTWLQEFEGLA